MMLATPLARGWIVLLALAGLGAAGHEGSLVEAVKKADMVAVRALLQQPVDVNTPEADGTTALHWAVRHDDLETAQLLLRAGANVKATNRYGVMPLTAACVNGNAAMIEALLNAGADPNSALPEGETALMTAARTGKVDALKVLLANGANVTAKERWRGQTALMWAAAENHAAVVQALIEAGADVNARSNGGFTPLLFAVRAGQIDAIRVLVAAGADVNDTAQVSQAASRTSGTVTPQVGASNRGGDRASTGGPSALVVAVVNANYEVGAFLLEHGADPNADAQGWTPLHQLAWTRRPPINKGLPPPVPNGNLDSMSFAKALLEHGANPNARQKKEPNDGHRMHMMSRFGATPFFLAAKGTDVDLMRLLVAYGADPLLTTDEGATPLMAAAGIGIWKLGENAGTNEEALEAVTLAWELGNDVNAADTRGMTALHGAAIRGANAIVRFLMDKGARIDARNKIGWTPLTITEGVMYPNTFTRWPDTAALLRQLGATDPGTRRAEDLPPAEVFSEAAAAKQKPQ